MFLVRNQFIPMLIKMKKILLRNHGLHTNVKLLDVTLEEQKGCIKRNLEAIFLKKICIKKKGYISKKQKSANFRHRFEMKKTTV